MERSQQRLADVQIMACTHDRHAAQILAILNDAIVNTTALYDYHARPLSSMAAWFAAKQARGFPVLGAIDTDQRLMGFASYGTFRAWPANKYTVEHSVYVHADYRGRGVAHLLLRELIATAREQQYHVLVGGIDVANAASIALHEKLGFVHAGTIRHAAFKFGRWLDLGFYQLILDTPDQPVDG
jgi:phosphinothricin acetyltransferase